MTGCDDAPPAHSVHPAFLHAPSGAGARADTVTGRTLFPRPGQPEWLQLVLSQTASSPGRDLRPPDPPGSVAGYQALAALSPEPVVIVDGALRVLVANRPFAALFNLDTPGILAGRSILDTLVEWDRVRAANLVARYLTTGIWDIAELTALRPDGTTFPVEARCEMLNSPAGEFAGMLVMVRDLTARQEAEDPLRAIVAGTAGTVGQAFLGSLVRHLAQIFSVRFAVVGELVEPERRRVQTVAFWADGRLADNFGYDLLGTPCDRVAAGETCFYPEGIQARFPEDAWLREVGAEGYVGTPLVDSHGRVIGLLEVLDTAPIYRSRDVSSIMRIFAARASAELERLRIERELERSRELLLQSRKLEGIARLAGGIAHDFNNLLTTILGHGDAALQAVGPDHPAQDDLRQVREAALGASGLTEQLLTFARRQTVSPRLLDLGDLLEASTPLLTRLVGTRVTFTRQVADDLWPVRADPGQIEQMLMALTINAADAMPEGGELRITAENFAGDAVGGDTEQPLAGGDWVRLVVTDTGIGMPPEVLTLAFEPFFSTKADGTGLGLAACHGIVRQAGGQIWAESSPGQGTRVTVLLPRASGTPLPLTDAGTALPPGGHETVLVVEDEPSVRRLAVRSLAQLGYRVVEAPDADSAFAAVVTMERAPDLVVSDVLLPGMAGPEMVRQLLARHPAMRVLFVSGFADNSFGEPGVAQPEHPFLPKPYTPQGLALAVREALDR